ncbi:MAG: histidine kinase [Chloroflexi bacterium]|nr:histidine kinase [Chloroflexota bacterium]
MQWIARQQVASDPDAAPLRRVGLRLAALTVGLLFVLLLTSSVVVYITTRNALLQSLEATLQSHAKHPPHTVSLLVQGLAPPTGNGTNPDSEGVFYTVFATNPNLTLLGSTSGFTPPIADLTSAQAVVASNGAPSWGQATQNGQDYLTYSEALPLVGGGYIVLQAGISEQQYAASLNSLLKVLLTVNGFGILASAGISVVLARRALQPIQLAMRRQRDFVADAAHELRTPLAIMRTAAELGLADDSQGEQQRALEQTLAQNNHLTRLVESLSLLARADSGAITLDRAVVDLSGLAEESVEAVEMLAEDRGIRLSTQSQPGIRAFGDIGRLRQLLFILLDNALKYTPEGGSVLLSVVAQSGMARLEIRDTGPGIDPQDLPRLFDRFYRADRARTGEGTGLGLAIGRWIAEAHGGRIVATNAPDGGALFTVTLPLAK